MTGYGEDLAWIHDQGYSSVDPRLLRLLPRRGFVVDLGCGSGVWARALTDRGHDVLGIDQSAAMIRLARRRAPRARFRVQSVYDAQLPPCDAVTALGEVFNYAFRRGELSRVIARVHAALAPGGLFVFDCAEPGRATGQHHRVEADWVCLADSSERGLWLTRSIISFCRVGKSWRRSDEVHRLRLYRATDVLAQLHRCGFRARVLGRRLGLVGFVAVKARSGALPAR